MGLKNMFGMLTKKRKFLYHIKDMNKVIYDICKTIPPTMTVIDGFDGKEGRGPWHGKAVYHLPHGSGVLFGRHHVGWRRRGQRRGI